MITRREYAADGSFQDINLTSDEIAAQALLVQQSTTQQLIQQAQQQLDVNDKVAIRCFKAAIAYPAEWYATDVTLRAIVSSGTGSIPTQPAFPIGT